MPNDFDEYEEVQNRKVYSYSEQEKIAHSYFNATGLQGEVKSKVIPVSNVKATYFAQTFQGGNSVIVDSNGDSLFAKNGISPQSHLEAFLQGKRTKAPYFKTQQENNSPVRKPVREDTNASSRGSNNEYAVDPKTGKRYKKLPGAPSEAIKAHEANKKSGLTLDQARKMIPVDEDFDIDDLTSTAELFMSHLRVPPNKEEIAELKKERENRMKRVRAEQKAMFEKEAAEDKKRAEAAFNTDLEYN